MINVKFLLNLFTVNGKKCIIKKLYCVQHIRATEYGLRPKVGVIPAIFFLTGNIFERGM